MQQALKLFSAITEFTSVILLMKFFHRPSERLNHAAPRTPPSRWIPFTYRLYFCWHNSGLNEHNYTYNVVYFAMSKIIIQSVDYSPITFSYQYVYYWAYFVGLIFAFLHLLYSRLIAYPQNWTP